MARESTVIGLLDAGKLTCHYRPGSVTADGPANSGSKVSRASDLFLETPFFYEKISDRRPRQYDALHCDGCQ